MQQSTKNYIEGKEGRSYLLTGLERFNKTPFWNSTHKYVIIPQVHQPQQAYSKLPNKHVG